jgi:hypothetical protein
VMDGVSSRLQPLHYGNRCGFFKVETPNRMTEWLNEP